MHTHLYNAVFPCHEHATEVLNQSTQDLKQNLLNDPSLRALDLTVTTESVPGCQGILQEL